mgnify:CR=1 FL=1
MDKIGLKFDVIPSNYEENLPDDNFSYDKIEMLALNKAKEVLSRVNDDGIIISADTVVVFNGKILGKPHSKEDAFNMITALSNNTHEVITSIAMIDIITKKTIVHSKSTKVKFRAISKAEVEKYISTNEPYDKAGAYAAQGLASVFIEKIDGCFNNVVGISTFEIDKMLKEMQSTK